jgi:hypothetical protein
VDKKNTGSLAERLQRLKRATSREAEQHRDKQIQIKDVHFKESPINGNLGPRTKKKVELTSSTNALMRVISNNKNRSVHHGNQQSPALYSLGNTKKIQMRLTERVTETKILSQEEKTLFGSAKDHKKDLESLHTVLAKFKESKET